VTVQRGNQNFSKNLAIPILATCWNLPSKIAISEMLNSLKSGNFGTFFLTKIFCIGGTGLFIILGCKVAKFHPQKMQIKEQEIVCK
jgi:hypothetical protein